MISGAHLRPRQGATVVGPVVRAAKPLLDPALPQHQLDRAVGLALAHQVVEFGIGHMGVATDRGGQLRQPFVERLAAFFNRMPRLDPLAQIGGDQRLHQLHVFQAAPGCHVHPRCVMRFEDIGIGGHEGIMFVGGQVHRAPGHHDGGLGIALLSGGHQGAGIGERADACLRCVMRIEFQDRVIIGHDHPHLVTAAQIVEAGPVGVAVEEVLDRFRTAASGAQPVPFDQIGGGGAIAGGQGGGHIPPVRLHGMEGAFEGAGCQSGKILRHRFSRPTRQGQADQSHYLCHQSRHLLHFLAQRRIDSANLSTRSGPVHAQPWHPGGIPLM